MPILLGALLACVVVAIFFGVRIVTQRLSRNLDPISTMAMALVSYFAKLLFLGIGLYLVAKFTDPSTVNRKAFGITAMLAAVLWLVRDLRTYLKLRLHLPLPISTPETSSQAPEESPNKKPE